MLVAWRAANQGEARRSGSVSIRMLGLACVAPQSSDRPRPSDFALFWAGNRHFDLPSRPRSPALGSFWRRGSRFIIMAAPHKPLAAPSGTRGRTRLVHSSFVASRRRLVDFREEASAVELQISRRARNTSPFGTLPRPLHGYKYRETERAIFIVLLSIRSITYLPLYSSIALTLQQSSLGSVSFFPTDTISYEASAIPPPH